MHVFFFDIYKFQKFIPQGILKSALIAGADADIFAGAEKYDIFKHDKTMQQFIVVSRPVRRADDYWEVTCRLIDNNYSSRIDLDDYEFPKSLLEIPREYGNMLVRYQSVTGITDERIENAYTLLYKQLLKIRKLARNRN